MNRINPALLKVIDDRFDNINDKNKVLTYCACVELGTILTLYEWELFKTDEDEKKLIRSCEILFVLEDADNDTMARKYKLRYPLWTNEEMEEDLFTAYHKALVMRFKTLSQSDRILSNAKTREAFKELQMRHKNFDLQRIIDATIDYYENTEFAKNLDNFLDDLGDTKYMAWEKRKSKMI
jgi:hypothetical protein